MGGKVLCCRCGGYMGIVPVNGTFVDMLGNPLRCENCNDGGIPGKADKADPAGLGFLKANGAHRMASYRPRGNRQGI